MPYEFGTQVFDKRNQSPSDLMNGQLWSQISKIWKGVRRKEAGGPHILLLRTVPCSSQLFAMNRSSNKFESHDLRVPCGLKRFQKAEALHFIPFS